MKRGKGLGVEHGEHAIRTYLQARDEDAWDARAVRREDDVVRRDEKDGIRDGVFQGRVR